MPQDKLPSISEIMTSTADSVYSKHANIATISDSGITFTDSTEITDNSEITSSSNIPLQDGHEFTTSHIKNEQFEHSEHQNFCNHCEKGFKSEKDLLEHTCLHKPGVNVLFECQMCKSLFGSLEDLADHMKVHDQHIVVVNNGDNKTSNNTLTRVGYLCSYCDKSLGSKGSLMKHKELHKCIYPYECATCGKKFSLKGNRDKHQLIHDGNRPHKCQICDKTFTLKGNLQQHLKSHNPVKCFQCGICKKDFTLKGNLDKHLKRHENGLSKPRGSKKTGDKDDAWYIEVNTRAMDEVAEAEEEREVLEDSETVEIDIAEDDLGTSVVAKRVRELLQETHKLKQHTSKNSAEEYVISDKDDINEKGADHFVRLGPKKEESNLKEYSVNKRNNNENTTVSVNSVKASGFTAKITSNKGIIQSKMGVGTMSATIGDIIIVKASKGSDHTDS